MPRTRRKQKTNLTATTAKGREHKVELVSSVRGLLDQYETIAVLNVGQVRTEMLQELRDKFPANKLLLGKNKVMAVALGRSKEDEHLDNVHQLSKVLQTSAPPHCRSTSLAPPRSTSPNRRPKRSSAFSKTITKSTMRGRGRLRRRRLTSLRARCRSSTPWSSSSASSACQSL
jgi:hypothetical protein